MSNHQNHTNSLSYKDAGVDIDAGDALVSDIAPHAKRTRRSGADADLGGFGGLFDLKPIITFHRGMLQKAIGNYQFFCLVNDRPLFSIMGRSLKSYLCKSNLY